MGKYSSIFEPLTVKQMTIPNRIVMTPMGTNFGEQKSRKGSLCEAGHHDGKHP